MKVRPLGIVRQIVESAGSEITYFYDDLVFGDNNVFIVQFDDTNDSMLNLYFNKDCEGPVVKGLADSLKRSASEVKFTVQDKGFYTIVQKEGSENLEIVFE